MEVSLLLQCSEVQIEGVTSLVVKMRNYKAVCQTLRTEICIDFAYCWCCKEMHNGVSFHLWLSAIVRLRAGVIKFMFIEQDSQSQTGVVCRINSRQQQQKATWLNQKRAILLRNYRLNGQMNPHLAIINLPQQIWLVVVELVLKLNYNGKSTVSGLFVPELLRI